MAITVRNITDDQAERCKRLSGKGTVSAGLVECVDLLEASQERLKDAQERIRDLEEKLRVKDQTLHRAAGLARDLLAVVQQGDWLHG